MNRASQRRSMGQRLLVEGPQELVGGLPQEVLDLLKAFRVVPKDTPEWAAFVEQIEPETLSILLLFMAQRPAMYGAHVRLLLKTFPRSKWLINPERMSEIRRTYF